MGTVFKKTYTKPLPDGAELFTREGQQFARWKPTKGKARKAAVTIGEDGTPRLLIVASTYSAKYRDGAGIVRTVATGCRDEQAARSVLNDLEKQAERIRSKIITKQEAETIGHQRTPLAEHFDDYLAHLEAVGCSPAHRSNVKRQLEHVAKVCDFRALPDLNRQALEAWLNTEARKAQGKQGKGARTRNTYLAAMIAFGNWCTDPSVGRLLANPFARMTKANEKADRRRQRRAMTEEELCRLLDVARRRPLLDAMTVHTGKRAGQRYANLRDEVKASLELLGHERALIYKTLVLTGLRKGELASLTVGQVHLDEPLPFITLHAADEKNREGAEIVLRGDLADDLRQWLADRLQRLQAEARRLGEPIPLRSESGEALFNVATSLHRIFKRDLKAAGIATIDERGRTLDVHALRHTFGTLLSKGGVSPRTAQAAMRHSKIDLTMNVYTDPRLLDVGEAMESLPSLPLEKGSATSMQATGTADISPAALAPALAPTLAPTPGDSGEILSFAVQSFNDERQNNAEKSVDANRLPDTTNHTQSNGVTGSQPVRMAGLEPAISSFRRWQPGDASEACKEVTPTASGACTTACTNSPEIANAGSVETLAAALLGLLPGDRAKLVALLLAGSPPATTKPEGAADAG